MYTFKIKSKISPAKRPRFARGHAYSPDKVDREGLAMEFRSQYSGRPLECKLAITMQIAGSPRGDIDNLQKQIFDAMQDAGVVKNDSQIRKIKHYSEGHEETLIRLEEL